MEMREDKVGKKMLQINQLKHTEKHKHKHKPTAVCLKSIQTTYSICLSH